MTTTTVILSTEDLNRIFQALHTEHARLQGLGPLRVGRLAIEHAAELTERIRVHAADVAYIDGTNPNTCSHGYRFENGLCPSTGCGANT